MISVVIPLYNKEVQIVDTIESVLSQSFQDFEIIIVDDGSTDGSIKEAKKISDSRIRILQQPNGGVSKARNRGIREAKYDWIALLDADDIWLSHYLQMQYDLSLKYPTCDVCACCYQFKHSDGRLTPCVVRKIPFKGNHGILNNYFKVASCSNPPIWSSSVMIKKSAIIKIGGFPEGITSGEDLFTWAKLAVFYKIAYCRSIGAEYVLATSSQNSPPIDIESSKDFVSLKLQILFESRKKDSRYGDMLSFLAFWYKMRARINLTLGNYKAARHCALNSLYYKKTNLRSLCILLLSFTPRKLINFIMNQLS